MESTLVSSEDHQNLLVEVTGQSYSYFELKAANAQLQQFFRFFEERKNHAFGSDGYHADEVDPMINFIEEKTNTIGKLGNLLVEELDCERSKNLNFTLENLELTGQVADLTYKKEKMITHVKQLKRLFDENKFDSLRCSITEIGSLAESALCNHRFLFEVSIN